MSDASSLNAPADVPLEEYGERYFKRYNYADRPLGKFSMYWFARRYYARLLRRFAANQPISGRMLEIGTGLGHLLGLMADDFPDRQAYGIDIAHYAAEETRRNAPKASALAASADRLEMFTDGSFDLIVTLHLVEHLADPAAALRHMARMLTPGGLLLFATPNPVYRLRTWRDQPDAIAKDPTHINVHPPPTWVQWVEDSGFSLLRHFGDGLWDVPYVPLLPKSLQFALFGFPSLIQVMTGTTLIPLDYGVNQILIARKEATS
ncbi:MAG: class I SAM-dependent methyltransferase [Chloroflexi bacterium]|nr:class I SAM-dependent methyltransferase [Chloroflexota bacterium]